MKKKKTSEGEEREKKKKKEKKYGHGKFTSKGNVTEINERNLGERKRKQKQGK